MDKFTAQRIVRDTFKAPFDRKRYRDFINEFCNGFDESTPQNMGVPHAFSPHIKSCQRLGTFESPESELADVLVVQLTDSYKLERTRSALRDFVAHALKRGEGSENSYKEAALVAFVAPDSKSWRFSYVRMEYETKRNPKTGKIRAEERLTPARRYSYLVGADEQCHTAQTRFLALLQNISDHPTLAQIEDAFSVETVTKEFFSEYTRLFNATEQALVAVVKRDKKIRDEFRVKGISTVDFAKKLLGQIVFLYFIQKKGWLGVAQGGKWGDGPRNFMRMIVDRAIGEKKCLFTDVLEPLFYDTLATDRGGVSWCKTFQCRIPFLNGGLFEPLAGYDWEKDDIELANTLFTNNQHSPVGDVGTGILDVFDRYNFTVNEAEPLEKEVAIDPEMLGKVFENLIEENRRKGLGAYYTPREIVHFMCQESLINYLDNGLNHPAKPIGAATPLPENQPPLFVNSAEKSRSKLGQLEFTEPGRRSMVPRAELAEWIQQSNQFAHYAAAIASGTKGDHYPKPPDTIRKYAHEIDALLRDITVCDPAIGSGAFPVGMMSEIIRARTALTPYFNDLADRTVYSFKRHAIQNSLYGVDIDVGAVEIAKLRLWLSLVVDEEDVQQIKPLPNLDYKIVVGNSLLGVKKNLFNQGQFKRLDELKPKFFNESDRKKKTKFKRQIDNLIHELTNNRAAFDFEIYFSEVFQEKGGFDVIIANPPYVDSEEMTRSSLELRKQYTQQFKSAKGNWDLFVVFIEQGLAKINNVGSACFIVPNKLLGAPYAKHIRQLLSDQHVNFIRDYSAVPVFAGVAVYPIVFQVSHARSIENVVMQRMISVEEADNTNLVESKTFHASNSWDQFFQAASHGSLIERFQKWPPLSEHCMDVVSAATVAEAYLLSDEMKDESKPSDTKAKKFINTGTIDPFQSLWGTQKTRYIKQGYDFPVVLKAAIRSISERRLAQADSEKLIIGGMNRHIECVYDKGEYLAGKSTTIVLPKSGVPLLYLGAILNSKCASYWYRTFFKSMALAGGYLRIGAGQLRLLPIPPYQPDTGKTIVDLAQRLQHSPTSEELWKQLNNAVYGLYNLTPEEIAQVETAREE